MMDDRFDQLSFLDGYALGDYLVRNRQCVEWIIWLIFETKGICHLDWLCRCNVIVDVQLYSNRMLAYYGMLNTDRYVIYMHNADA